MGEYPSRNARMPGCPGVATLSFEVAVDRADFGAIAVPAWLSREHARH
jgi:hypothetical protein